MARKTSPKAKTDTTAKRPRKGRRKSHASAPVSASEQGGIRSNAGQFQPGRSGNPGGRPKEHAEVKEMARAHTEQAIAVLAKWMLSDEPKAAIAAATALLDRAWGKPTQAITGEDGKPIDINLGVVRAGIAGKLARIAGARAA
jgi:hypothetical protein